MGRKNSGGDAVGESKTQGRVLETSWVVPAHSRLQSALGVK